MEPPTPADWSPNTATGTVLVLLAVTALFATPVLAQDSANPDGSFATSGDTLVLDRAADQTISGTTTLDPGTTVHVRLKSASAKSPFLRTRTTTVGDDGSFEVTFDLGDVGNSSSVVAFEADLRSANGTELAETEGVVVGSNADYTTSTTAKTTSTQPTTTSTVSAPGFGVVMALVAAALGVATRVTR